MNGSHGFDRGGFSGHRGGGGYNSGNRGGAGNNYNQSNRGGYNTTNNNYRGGYGGPPSNVSFAMKISFLLKFCF